MIRGTGLYELWKTGKYRNYTPDELVDLVAKILALVPPWTRVYRIQRYVRRVCVDGMGWARGMFVVDWWHPFLLAQLPPPALTLYATPPGTSRCRW